MQYAYSVEDVLLKMRGFCGRKTNDLGALNAIFESYMKNEERYRQDNADYLIARSLPIVDFNQQKQYRYYLMTFLLHATNNRNVYKKILIYCINDKSLLKETKFFLYHQMIGYSFLHSDVLDKEAEELQDDLYYQIYLAYKGVDNIGRFNFIQRGD